MEEGITRQSKCKQFAYIIILYSIYFHIFILIMKNIIYCIIIKSIYKAGVHYTV